jgi:hypothetical protein
MLVVAPAAKNAVAKRHALIGLVSTTRDSTARKQGRGFKDFPA